MRKLTSDERDVIGWSLSWTCLAIYWGTWTLLWVYLAATIVKAVWL